MPFKHNAARRRLLSVRNWSADQAGYVVMMLWLDDTGAWLAGMLRGGRRPGGQAWYSDAAIALVLMLRLVFHIALRQAEGFATSVLRRLGQELPVPDHTTLSRRSQNFAGRQPKVPPTGPMHLVIDSTGLKLFGQGEWDAENLAKIT